MNNVLLSAQNLTVGYSDGTLRHVLFNNQNLALYAGELVCFMGANGIGKSTLIRTLAGLQPSLSKTIIAGSILTRPNGLSSGRTSLSRTHKKGIAAQGREGGIDPKTIAVVLTDRINTVNMTVEELIIYGRYPHLDWNIRLTQKDTTIIEDAITQTHIGHLRKTKLYELSDGQLQMAMIARALAQDTPVILLDEPTAHLDLNNRVEIMNLLRRLARTSGKAILVATHELDLALQTSDLIWLATRDRNIITGIPEDLVLNGSFDDTFQFKGFDLKTGKVQHEAWRNKSVKLIGEGYEYLWTKNALERCGYKLSESSDILISINICENLPLWNIHRKELNSINELIETLKFLTQKGDSF
jgi:iron complex transport system ATP-binding protein